MTVHIAFIRLVVKFHYTVIVPVSRGARRSNAPEDFHGVDSGGVALSPKGVSDFIPVKMLGLLCILSIKMWVRVRVGANACSSPVISVNLLKS
jgi:hypothetical protein